MDYLMDICPDRDIKPPTLSKKFSESKETDNEKIRSDWENVGEYISTAMSNIENEQTD